MIRIKKAISILIVTVMMILSLSGCGILGSGQEQSTTTDEPSDAVVSLISLLEGEIKRLKAEQNKSDEKISELEKQLAELKETATSAPPPETTAKPDEEKSPFTYVIEGDASVITGYNGNYSVLSIPEELGGYPVKKIADNVFAGNTKLTSVTLPKKLEKLGWFAFSGCTSLKSITLPATLNEIGYDCFAYCTKLTIYCPSGSYSEKYAASYGIGCVTD